MVHYHIRPQLDDEQGINKLWPHRYIFALLYKTKTVTSAYKIQFQF